MTIEELGTEYLRQNELIRARIAELRKRRDTARPKQRLRLNSRINSLYDDALALRLTGEHLLSYYGGAK